MDIKIITVKPNNKCPNCKADIPLQRSVEGEHVPVPGDVSVCIDCQSILVYDDSLSSRNPTQAEIDEFKADEKLWNMIYKCRYYIKELN